MEESSNHINRRATGCAKCHNPKYERGYKVRLCKNCRRELSRYPITREVIWGALGVSVILLLALFRLPTYFKAGVDYMKGVQFAKERRYTSAEKIFTATLQKYPEHTSSVVHLITAAYFNDDLSRADSLLAVLTDKAKNLDDTDLIEELSVITDNSQYYNIQDHTIDSLLNTLVTDTPACRKLLEDYLLKAPHDLAAAAKLASVYLDINNYKGVDSLCRKAIHDAPLFRPPYYIMLASLKEQKKYKEGLDLSQQLLVQNKESLSALVIFTTFQLKLKKDKEALISARQAFDLAPDTPEALTTLSLACHFNHQQEESNRILAKLKNMPAKDSSQLEELQNIITDKTPYRD
ncbi:hypothetical protein [Chitinophaga sp. CF418]|uniref:hypothetical protein n=1 Tax=Chitinophaga sp. CF418 TaxID=1855287 RepID=UPI0009187479|nr:hypothetical protein [Chitinophaga sp. CF418]SHM52100.1 hypothetical protein SAMN05216311_102391 [Chitinophaga sp. CF418]